MQEGSGLPPEMWVHALSFLPFKGALRCRAVCRVFRTYIERDLPWRARTADLLADAGVYERGPQVQAAGRADSTLDPFRAHLIVVAALARKRCKVRADCPLRRSRSRATSRPDPSGDRALQWDGRHLWITGADPSRRTFEVIAPGPGVQRYPDRDRQGPGWYWSYDMRNTCAANATLRFGGDSRIPSRKTACTCYLRHFFWDSSGLYGTLSPNDTVVAFAVLPPFLPRGPCVRLARSVGAVAFGRPRAASAPGASAKPRHAIVVYIHADSVVAAFHHFEDATLPHGTDRITGVRVPRVVALLPDPSACRNTHSRLRQPPGGKGRPASRPGTVKHPARGGSKSK